MTVEQLHLEFKVFFDKVDSSSFPEFLDGEIDIYLNEGQERVIKQRYGKNNIYQKAFEESQKRTDDLKNLVKTKFVTVTAELPYTSVGMNIYRADINSLYDDVNLTIPSGDKYQFYLKSLANTCSGSCCGWEKVKLVQQDDISIVLLDPFNKPKKGRTVIFFEDGNIFVWAGDDTVSGFQLTFLKRANQINIGTYGQDKTECELSEHLHKEILQESINIAIENVGSPRVQTQGPINVKTTE